MSPRTNAPARRRARSFRLGEDEPRQGRPAWVLALVGFAVGALLFGGGGYLINKPSEQEQMAQDIRDSDAARDKEQVKSLTELARDTRDDLAPVLAGLTGETGTATAADVATWRQTVDAAARSFDNPPSGSTATNVARGSLTTAVDQLAVAVSAYEQSLTGGAGLRELAKRQRDLAVMTWSVGATQLDQINIDAGYGHQHVYLEGSGPDGQAFTPDSAPEGSG